MKQKMDYVKTIPFSSSIHPLTEYRCPRCGHLERKNLLEDRPVCPNCDSDQYWKYERKK